MKNDRERARGRRIFRAGPRGRDCGARRPGMPPAGAWLCLMLLWSAWMPVFAHGAAGGEPADAARPADAVSEDSQSRWETQSVRELMQQDLRDALRSPAGGPDRRTETGPALGIRPVLEPRLVALYGVGRTLMAEVQVGRRAYLYVRGQAWPAGHAGDRGVYQLRGMNGACVQLERGQDRHSLCLRMLLGEARP